MRCLGLIVALLIFAIPASAADTLIVAVASSLFAPAQTLAAQFEATHRVRVKLVPGSTGQLFSQIVQGAPYAVFMAADAATPERLVRQMHLASAPETFASGRLFICMRYVEPELARLSGTVAMADPRLAPYGRAAAEALHAARGASERRLIVVHAPNVMMAANYLRRGLVDAAFVASSAVAGDMQASCRQVDASLYRPILHQALLLDDTPLAHAWFDFIRSPEEAAVWRQAGFLPHAGMPGGAG